MNDQLTIQERLKDLRVERGLSLDQLAEATGLSRSALASYESDEEKEISMYSIKKLAELYDVSTDYLLGMTENRQHDHAVLSALHLSDASIKVLKNRSINNRLLSEIISHEGFEKLMMDIEIHVDGLAAIQLQSLNASVGILHAKLKKAFTASDHDYYLRVIEAAHIDEDRYFAGISHEDLDAIINDIKIAHSKDKKSAPVDNVAMQFIHDLDDVLKMKGSPQEKQVIMTCSQLHIKYDKLTPDEKVTLMNILKKSDMLGKMMVRHGKGNGRR